MAFDPPRLRVDWRDRAASAGNVILADSVTQLDDRAAGGVIVCGSHGGEYVGGLAIRRRVRGIILNDAGVGLDNAGIAGLVVLGRLGIPAATVGHLTARIGDARDMWDRGVITHCNDPAGDLGCLEGLAVPDAVALLEGACPVDAPENVGIGEARRLVRGGSPSVWALDSASLVRPADAGAVLVTGSHGGLVGADPASALRADALAALFNDAGVGIDGAGIGRLAALDSRRISAATVSASSARIGVGLSTYSDGVISCVNVTARERGASVGMDASSFVDIMLQTTTDR
jgi:hypothetical protein